ncbi:MAG TPA: hypothetical protein VFR24_17210 [Candidatus Angelobacter sp.]|nr:hypothetical protein [Candidatus Angelobacter sp.]
MKESQHQHAVAEEVMARAQWLISYSQQKLNSWNAYRMGDSDVPVSGALQPDQARNKSTKS